MKQKIALVLNGLNRGLVEREEAIKLALLTVLAGENLVLIGPPGTGKSLIARRIAASIEGGGYFEYLLTKFSTPEEIFGPLSIAELKADRFRRNTAGYLPDVDIAFLDEIFKASSSILNALLTLLNERKFHNGNQLQDVPLQSLIAASNELPTGQEELSALYDRFLVRCFVGYVSDKGLRQLVEADDGDFVPETRLTLEDFAVIRKAAGSVVVPSQISEAIMRIWRAHKEKFKEDSREALSDRRFKKVLKLLRVSAAVNERSEVDISDVMLLKNCLWNHQDNAKAVHDIVLDAVRPGSSTTRPAPNSTTKVKVKKPASPVVLPPSPSPLI